MTTPLRSSSQPAWFESSGSSTAAWQHRAYCGRYDTDLFFATESEPVWARHRRETLAKRICSQCPVVVQCRELALALRAAHGIWGGLTEVERRSIR
ncbi:hypothetical protein CH263_12500 [Rhodococcus sp. 06-1059B-a]|nr:WhiB family transcriptional regulator [Rhodococcus sp. 06-1059B-a]OZD65727.1 hypothetical protein CH263_12500 [Rhodococcus sp. 06-1059B-a]